jgi:hypothetical protein
LIRISAATVVYAIIKALFFETEPKTGLQGQIGIKSTSIKTLKGNTNNNGTALPARE